MFLYYSNFCPKQAVLIRAAKVDIFF